MMISEVCIVTLKMPYYVTLAHVVNLVLVASDVSNLVSKPRSNKFSSQGLFYLSLCVPLGN